MDSTNPLMALFGQGGLNLPASPNMGASNPLLGLWNGQNPLASIMQPQQSQMTQGGGNDLMTAMQQLEAWFKSLFGQQQGAARPAAAYDPYSGPPLPVTVTPQTQAAASQPAQQQNPLQSLLTLFQGGGMGSFGGTA